MEKLTKLQKILLVISITCIVLFLWCDGEGILGVISLISGFFGVFFGIAFIINLVSSNKKYELEKVKRIKNKNRFKPSKLKENLLILEERGNSYYFKPTYQLKCSNQSFFKVKIHANVSKSIFGGTIFTCKEDGVGISAICNQCGKELEIFNSTKDGYDGYLLTDKKVDFSYEEFYCLKCKQNDFTIEIEYEFDTDKAAIKELKETMEEVKKEDITNTFGWISITIKCNHCGKVYKKIIDYECM